MTEGEDRPQLSLAARAVATVMAMVSVLVSVAILLASWNRYVEGGHRVADLESRIARFEGYVMAAESLRHASEKVAGTVAGLAFAAGGDSSNPGTSLQQQLRQQLGAVGLEVSASQVLASKEDGQLGAVRVELSATGPIEALDQALMLMPTLRPLVSIESLEISPSPQRRGESVQNLFIRVRVSSPRLP